MFDDVFRGFDLAPFGSFRASEGLGWPNIDVDETETRSFPFIRSGLERLSKHRIMSLVVQ
jgi:hypothetical protein